MRIKFAGKEYDGKITVKELCDILKVENLIMKKNIDKAVKSKKGVLS